jgi:hypothetical protein
MDTFAIEKKKRLPAGYLPYMVSGIVQSRTRFQGMGAWQDCQKRV